MPDDFDPNEDVWFDESDVNIEMLMDVFNTNTMSSEKIENGIFVKAGFDYPISITIDDYCGVLKLRAEIALKYEFDEEEIVTFLDHLNENTSCASFYFHTDKNGLKKIIGSAFITYHIGLTLRFFYITATAFASSFISGCKVDNDGSFFDFPEPSVHQKRLM